MAEIAARRQLGQSAAVTQNELEAELEYGRELAAQMELLSASHAGCERFREETLGELALEMAQCEKTGDLSTLQSELSSLQSELAWGV